MTQTKEKLQPFLKWAGGKRQLLPELKKRMPEHFNAYYEPCLGGGALVLDLQPERAVINDKNQEIWNLWYIIKWYHLFLMDELKKDFKYQNTEEKFKEIRGWDRLEVWPSIYPGYERAARTLYLNKTCYNGLYRLNSHSQFNSPWGKHKTAPDYGFTNICNVHNYLKRNDITITNLDFFEAVKEAQFSDFVYFDPPYDAMSKTANFTAYTADGFTQEDQKRLFDTVRMLTEKGVYCMVSNAATPFILNLWGNYPRFKLSIIESKRSINCRADLRDTKPCEVIITNY